MKIHTNPVFIFLFSIIIWSIYNFINYLLEINDKSIRQRPIYDTKTIIKTNSEKNLIDIDVDFDTNSKYKPKNLMKNKFRKIILLIVAVTVHNIPEGLAVGVGFGA